MDKEEQNKNELLEQQTWTHQMIGYMNAINERMRRIESDKSALFFCLIAGYLLGSWITYYKMKGA